MRQDHTKTVTARATGRTEAHHITGDVAPLVEVDGDVMDGDVVRLPDGTLGYAWSAAGEIGVFAAMVARDAGGNEHNRRTPPQVLTGLLRCGGTLHVTKSGDGLLAWVKL